LRHSARAFFYSFLPLPCFLIDGHLENMTILHYEVVRASVKNGNFSHFFSPQNFNLKVGTWNVKISDAFLVTQTEAVLNENLLALSSDLLKKVEIRENRRSLTNATLAIFKIGKNEPFRNILVRTAPTVTVKPRESDTVNFQLRSALTDMPFIPSGVECEIVLGLQFERIQ
jgi:hypothetical protein